MIICLIRHGDAVTEGYSEDSLYPLSEEGKEATLCLCEKLAEKKISPNRIYTSPLKRAEETAKIIGMCFSIPFERKDALKDFDSQALLTLIEENIGKTIFFVGHAPDLMMFANLLANKDIGVKTLEKSSAIILEFQEAPGFKQAIFKEYIK